MSRRDTIIIAVLINACLLIILFATALTKKEETPFSAREVATPSPANVNIQDIQRTMVKQTSFSKTTPKLSKPSLPVAPLEESLPKVALIEPKVEHKSEPKKEEIVEPSKSLPAYIQITVKRGDYLARIAKENETRVEDIMKLNNLKSTQLKIGQILRIPAPERSPLKSGENKPTPPKQYMVKPGDTLWGIAKFHNMQVGDLLKMNHMSSDSANRLQPGDTLLVR